MARDGKTLWSKPIGQVMGATVSSDTGWSFQHDEKADRYVGWMRAALPAESRELAQAGQGFSYDLDVLRLASINGTDGTVEWLRKGAEHSCLGMNTDAPTVRCVFEGVVTYSAEGELTDVKDGSAVVEGFDPETGKTTWTLPIAPDAVADAVDDRDQKVAGDKTILVETDDGPRVVDVATGKTAAPAADEVFACASENTIFRYATPFFSDNKPVTRRYGGPLLRPCTADGSNAPAYTVAAVKDGGQEAGEGRYVVAGTRRLARLRGSLARDVAASADLLGQRDHDALGPADVGHPPDVLVARRCRRPVRTRRRPGGRRTPAGRRPRSRRSGCPARWPSHRATR